MAASVRIAGMMRVKNEFPWIEESIRSIAPLCRTIHVLDDHSTDGTLEILAKLRGRNPHGCHVDGIPSPFRGWDEARDKNFLLGTVLENEPDWILCIDGDEVLVDKGNKGNSLQECAALALPEVQALALKIVYLWDSPHQIRVDGRYGRFWRSSLFRVKGLERGFSSSTHGTGRNLHCGNAPHGLHAIELPITLKHYGYMLKEDRERKKVLYGDSMYPRLEGEPELKNFIG